MAPSIGYHRDCKELKMGSSENKGKQEQKSPNKGSEKSTQRDEEVEIKQSTPPPLQLICASPKHTTLIDPTPILPHNPTSRDIIIDPVCTTSANTAPCSPTAILPLQPTPLLSNNPTMLAKPAVTLIAGETTPHENKVCATTSLTEPRCGKEPDKSPVHTVPVDNTPAAPTLINPTIIPFVHANLIPICVNPDLIVLICITPPAPVHINPVKDIREHSWWRFRRFEKRFLGRFHSRF
jgi:hypothetical protein